MLLQEKRQKNVEGHCIANSKQESFSSYYQFILTLKKKFFDYAKDFAVASVVVGIFVAMGMQVLVFHRKS